MRATDKKMDPQNSTVSLEFGSYQISKHIARKV